MSSRLCTPVSLTSRPSRPVESGHPLVADSSQAGGGETRVARSLSVMSEELQDPTAEEISAWIQATYPETVTATAMGATFFSLDESHWPNFATIVTTDEHDMGEPSKLSRPGVFRLNIATRKATFQRLVGGITEPDYSALDRIMPHPVYAKELWVCVLNPSRKTFHEQVEPLIAESYERLAQARRRRT